ncbi:MAG: helix-turn-helix domain-containing protein, partial [Planctomycetota bacterium JB042]
MPPGPVRRVAVSEVTYAPEGRMPPHAHRTAGIGLVLTGRVDEEVHGATWASGALSVVVKPAGIVHEDRFGERGARLLSLSLPRRSGLRLERYVWFHGGEVVRRGVLVLRALREGGETEARREVEGMLDAIVRARPDRAPPPPWVARARDWLEGGCTVAEAARRVGVHPGSLTRAYRRAFGVSPVADRARRRVGVAADLLASTPTDLVAVAATAG